MKPLVSIIIPVYNIENNIIYCIESVLRQTYHNYEVLLIDDGSTDSSGYICDEYASKNEKVHVFHQNNRGLSAARNIGIIESLGTLIMFVDGDDMIADKMLENLIIDFYSHKDVIYSSCRYQRISKYEMLSLQSSKQMAIDSSEVVKDLLTGEYDNISAWGKLYNKNKIGELRFSEGKIHFEDKAFLFFLLLNNPKGFVIERKDELYGYYYRDNSITNSKYNTHYLDILFHSERMLLAVQNRLPQYILLGKKNDVVSHLMLLKSIVRSKVYKREKKLFNSIKNNMLQKYGDMDKRILGKYWYEMHILKGGNFLYIVFVYLHDFAKRSSKILK